MALMSFFRKKLFENFYIFSFFVCLLPGFVNKRSHNTFLVFEKSVIEHILRAKVWLYGFKSVFWQILTDSLFVVHLLLFL